MTTITVILDDAFGQHARLDIYSKVKSVEDGTHLAWQREIVRRAKEILGSTLTQHAHDEQMSFPLTTKTKPGNAITMVFGENVPDKDVIRRQLNKIRFEKSGTKFEGPQVFDVKLV